VASPDMIQLIRPHVPLIEMARKAARERGQHYNQFLVGAAGTFEMPDGSRQQFVGGNYKPTPGTQKKCAEHFMFEKAKAAGAVRVVVIAVAGPQKQDDESGVEGLTLHPCGVCRALMRQNRMVDDNTLIVTVQFSNGEPIAVELPTATVEVHSLRGLLAFHHDPT